MNLIRLTLSYVRQRPLQAALNVVMLALGIATIVVLLLFSSQARHNLEANAEGIGAVVGAKGSPLQLILSSVYHMDVPTGNIPVEQARQIQAHPLVASSIPLALGDSYRGFRIVGTTEQYPQHYDATLATGRWWDATYEVTVGHRVAREQGLSVGDSVVSAHGLTGGGDMHDDRPLPVVGVMAETGTIVDRLLLTSVETVWAVHGQHEDEDHDHEDSDHDDHDDEDHDHGDHGDDEDHSDAHDDEHAHDDHDEAHAHDDSASRRMALSQGAANGWARGWGLLQSRSKHRPDRAACGPPAPPAAVHRAVRSLPTGSTLRCSSATAHPSQRSPSRDSSTARRI